LRLRAAFAPLDAVESNRILRWVLRRGVDHPNVDFGVSAVARCNRAAPDGSISHRLVRAIGRRGAPAHQPIADDMGDAADQPPAVHARHAPRLVGR
jgi:hypothetical protein